MWLLALLMPQIGLNFSPPDLHQHACNARLNIDKSEFLPLSDAAADLILPIGHSLPRDQTFTHLGIPFHPKAWPLPVGFFNSLLGNSRVP